MLITIKSRDSDRLNLSAEYIWRIICVKTVFLTEHFCLRAHIVSCTVFEHDVTQHLCMHEVLSAPDVQKRLLFLCTPADEVSFCPCLIIKMLPHVSLKAACFISTVRHCCSTLVCNYRNVSDRTKDVG